MVEFRSTSLKELRDLAEKLAAQARPRDLFFLYGELGAGKTQFVNFFVTALGGEAVSSPTFALHQQYKTPQFIVEHFDLYRIQDEDGLATVGFWDVLRESQGIVFVEWPERLSLGGGFDPLSEGGSMAPCVDGVTDFVGWNLQKMRILRL